MSNYVCAPYSCLSMWAARRVLTLRDGKAESRSLVKTSSAVLDRCAMVATCSRSSLLRVALSQPDHACMHAACFAKSFKHNTMDVELNSWLLVSSAEGRAVMRVSEIAQMWSTSGSCMRMWCTDARQVTHSHQQGPHFSIDASISASCMLIRLELVCLSLLRCARQGERMTFRYSY